MRRIINGKRYDTDKATLVGEACHGEPGEAGYTRTTLYRKRGGEYFFRIQGPCGVDNIVRGITPKAAGDFVLDNMGRAAYEREFEGTGTVGLSLQVAVTCKRMLDRMANETGRKRSEIIEDCISRLYDKMYGRD